MTTSLRFETSSTSPDGNQFLAAASNGHRGHGMGSSTMDRSSSFRDHVGGSTTPAGGEPVPLSQVLSLERIPLGEDRYARQPELKRATNAATGLITDDPSLGQVQSKGLELLPGDDLKRVKSYVFDISGRARERARHFSEAISKLDKYRKKRSRPEGGGVVPNKRLRTSIDGARPSNAGMKKSADRESPRSAPPLPSPTEDKGRTPEASSKLKGRRSGIKADPGLPAAPNGVVEPEREHRWSGQHRLSQESRPRPSETHGLRSGPVHGVTSMHKGEASGQMNGSARGLLKRDGDVADRFLGPDKERIPKNGLTTPLQDEGTLPGMSPIVAKGKGVRGPRSSSVAAANPSHLGARSASFTDRDKGGGGGGASKVQANPGQGGNNRKRPAPSRSSSPVAQWVGQRPQKNARIARRVNLPIGSALPASEGLTPEAMPEPAAVAGVRSAVGTNSGVGVSRRSSPTQGKPRSERAERAAVISESEESEEVGDGVLANGKLLKGKKQADWEARSMAKTGNLVLPPKVGQPMYRDRDVEVGDGVRRQGRSGRSFSTPKPVPTTVDKGEVGGNTAKQLRSARTDKPERPGRTPTKKGASDRKSLIRRRPIGGAAIADTGAVLISPADSDDDHEELALAVRAAVDASADACPNDFWKEMEPYFAFVTSEDLSYLRQLAESKSNTDSSTPSTECTDRTPQAEASPDRLEVRTGGRMGGSGGWFDKIYPLSQRLLAALINEGEDEDTRCEPQRADVYSASEKYREADAFQGNFYSNGHGHHQSGPPAYDEATESDDILADNQSPENNHLLTGTKVEGFATSRPGAPWEGQYEQLSLDDRILLELQSIGLAVEQVPDLSQRDEDELCSEICKLQDELKNQASVNRERVEMLEKAVLSRREIEARERERLALSKLVGSAYTKRKGFRGSGSAGSKGGTKGARAAAIAFSKRTLARVRRFESGHSCIVDSALRDVLLCKQSRSSTSEPAVDGDPYIAAAAESVRGKLVVRRTDGNSRQAETPGVPRDISPENGAPTLRTAGFGGAKGKRSERERDGKGQGKESHRKNDQERVPRQGMASVKGERKTKTKPRQKAAPIFKDVNNLLGKPAAEAPKQPLQQPVPNLLGPAEDLIPDDLGEIGDWLTLDDPQDDSILPGVGLDVPMDDLADLGMMM